MQRTWIRNRLPKKVPIDLGNSYSAWYAQGYEQALIYKGLTPDDAHRWAKTYAEHATDCLFILCLEKEDIESAATSFADKQHSQLLKDRESLRDAGLLFTP